MKNSHKNFFSFGLAGLLFSIGFTGCSDSDDSDNESYDPTSTQVSVDAPIAGDIITYIPTTVASLGSRDIIFDGVETIVGETSYTYQKTGDHTFSVFLDRSISGAVDSVIDQILKTQSLGTEFRQLLLDTDQDNDEDFENPNSQRIVDILSQFGIAVRLSPDGSEIHYPTGELYSHRVTSNAEDFLLGSLGGVYTTQSQGVIVGYRLAEPTDSRFFADPANTSAQFWVPFLSDEGFSEENSEQGAFTIDFINIGQ